ncbi:MAG: hypothetical protein ABIO44_07120 [Saprospiraceae bacterium]
MNKLIIAISLFCFISCKSSHGVYVNKKDIDIKALLGTWQIKDQQKFEKWALVSPTECIGVDYDMSSGIATIDENLRLFKVDDKWIFEAKTKEHEFKPVLFAWMPDPMTKMRFVNEKNEFPQIIRYKMNSDSTMVAEISDMKGGIVNRFEYLKVVRK